VSEAEDLSFAGAGELFEALQGEDPLERRKIMGWVATHPDEAIGFGRVDGRDVVDVLIGLINPGFEFRYWEDIAITIGVFNAPRVTEFFARLLETADSPSAALYASRSLQRRDRSGLADRLVAVLMGEDDDRAVAAAELLAGDEALPPAAAVRVAVLEQEHDPPELNDEVFGAWRRELTGPFALQAQQRLEALGPDAAPRFLQAWDDLDVDGKIWLLGWTAAVAPAESAALADVALETGPEELALEAIQISEEAGLELESAKVARWVGADEATLEQLAERLSDESPEVRAEARERIVAIGPEAVATLRPLVRSEEPEVRAAAVRALLDLGDDDWLADALLD
jgi:hypothetical protein